MTTLGNTNRVLAVLRYLKFLAQIRASQGCTGDDVINIMERSDLQSFMWALNTLWIDGDSTTYDPNEF